MRGNGLTADDYGLVADVSRTVAADALLALREVGVAAYVVLPETPGADDAQVFADRAALAQAREVVRRLADDVPEVAAADDTPATLVAEDGHGYDEVWAQIVAGYGRSADEPAAPALPAAPEHPSDAAPVPPSPGSRPEEEEHFVPPVAPPVPATDLVGRLAWGGLFGGPLLLLVATVLGWGLPGPVTLLCVGAFVGGLVTLIVRMQDRPPGDWGGDDGAVV
ncbi:MAG: hypothetical protein M3P83_02390 [Actinomycetota bacterium]|nr:hypothetical protein [Actinomycetota bacterium]